MAEGVTTYDKPTIKKELQVPHGVKLEEQDKKFTFTFTQVTEDGNEFSGEDGKIEIANQAVTVKAGDNGAYDADSNLDIYKVESQLDISSNFKDATVGHYCYKVEETSKQGENWHCDDSVYYLHVWKTNSGVKYTMAKPEKAEGENAETTPGINDGKVAAMSFINGYEYNPTDKKTDKNIKLQVIKAMDGDDTDFFNKDQKFEITIKYRKPGQQTTEELASKQVEVSVNTPVTIEDIPEGSEYTVSEGVVEGYTNTKIVTVTDGAEGKATTINDSTTESEKAFVGVKESEESEGGKSELLNKITVYNKFKDVSFTGLVINNAPFVLMIGIPVVAGAVWVARRRSAQN